MTTPPGVETELGWALGTVMRRYLRMAEQALAGVPGGPRGYLVLATVGSGEPSTQLALAQHLGVDRTMMTYLLDDLEAAGLVERRADPADRRARRVTLTEAGSTRLGELRCALHRAEDGLLEPLPPDDRAALRDGLQRLAVTMVPAHPCQVAQELAAEPAPAAARTIDIGGRRRRR